MGRYNLSPSRFARYYFHKCDRFLRYSATPKHLKRRRACPRTSSTTACSRKPSSTQTSTGKAEVLATYLIGSAVIAHPPPDNPGAAKTSCVHTALQTIEALRNAAPGQYIYQPT
jgi:hypothetical protein